MIEPCNIPDNDDSFCIDYSKGYQETYDFLTIGDRMEVLVGNKFERGILLSKKIDKDNSYSGRNVFITVQLDDGRFIEDRKYYDGFYPCCNKID